MLLMYHSGFLTGGGDIEEHGVHPWSFGGQDGGAGEAGQVLRASARARAYPVSKWVFSACGVKTANPSLKVLRKVRWRCEVISCARSRRPSALFSASVVVMDL